MDNFAVFSQLYSHIERFGEQLTWSRVSAGWDDCVKKIDHAVGCVFSALAAAINNANVLGSALQGVRYASFTANYIHTGKVGEGSRLDQAIRLISMTRIFSDLCYLFSGEFITDARDGRLGLMLGQFSCGISNGIKSCQALIRMIQDCESSNSGLNNEGQDSLSRVGDGFAVAGLLGHIGDAIQRLVASSACNLQAWLDFGAAVCAICLPIAALAGVTSVPFLLSLGILSCLFSVLGALLADCYGDLEEKTPDFAEHSKDLAKFFSTASSCLSVFHKCLGEERIASFREFTVAVKSFSSIRKGLEIINRFKEWFSEDKDGNRFWQKSSIWKVGNKVFLAGETLLNFHSFLGAFAVAKSETFLNKVPIFGLLKTAFTLGALVCAVIDHIIKWIKIAPEHARLTFKKFQWDLMVESLEGDFSSSQASRWNQMQQQLVERYNWKLQSELARGEAHDAAKVALWQRHIVNISTGQTAAFLNDKCDRHLQRLQEILSNSCLPELREAFQAEINTFHHFSSLDFANYRRTLAINRFNRSSADMAKTGWAIASKTFKGALTLASVGLEFCGASAFVAAIPKSLSMIHKVAAFCFDIFIAMRFKFGEETLLLSAVPSDSMPHRALRRRLRYLRAA